MVAAGKERRPKGRLLISSYFLILSVWLGKLSFCASGEGITGTLLCKTLFGAVRGVH
jgi:hypothetical protein